MSSLIFSPTKIKEIKICNLNMSIKESLDRHDSVTQAAPATARIFNNDDEEDPLERAFRNDEELKTSVAPSSDTNPMHDWPKKKPILPKAK